MTITSHAELAAMRRVGRLVARTLTAMREAVRPGVTTARLDEVGERFARAAGARVLAVHHEHTIVVRRGAPLVLTLAA